MFEVEIERLMKQKHNRTAIRKRVEPKIGDFGDSDEADDENVEGVRKPPLSPAPDDDADEE